VKALAIVLAVLLVIAHPAAAAAVVAVELAAIAALGIVIWRAVRPLRRGRHRRTA
jgi:hypothetical protein